MKKKIVAYAVHGGAGLRSGLTGGRCAGGVGMLADDDAAAAHQGVGGLSLGIGVEPGAGVENVHNNVFNYALYAKIVGGVAGNDLSIRESADVTELYVAVFHIGIGDLAFVYELLKLHAGNNAGNITGLIGVAESVLEVLQSADGSGIAGHGGEHYVGVFIGSLLHIGLMAIAVGEDVGAALLDQVDSCVVAFLILGYVVLPKKKERTDRR